MTKKLALLFGYVFIDVLGFSLILPLLPFYAESFEASPTVVGLLLAANAITQLIGAPLIGRLSDRYGRRPLLLVSISGTVLGFVLLGLANSLWMLFLSRILDGFLGGNIYNSAEQPGTCGYPPPWRVPDRRHRARRSWHPRCPVDGMVDRVCLAAHPIRARSVLSG
jgi:MFS family permease